MKRAVSLLLCALWLVPAYWARADENAAEGSPAGEEDEPAMPEPGMPMGMSQGVDRLLAEVYTRKKELAEAERDVERREAAVRELETMIDERIEALEADRRELETRIAKWETQDGDRIKKLAKVYAELPPSKAARLLSNLELDLAVSVLSGMKQKSSAEVLAAIAPDRALVMSRRMARPLAASPDARSGKKK